MARVPYIEKEQADPRVAEWFAKLEAKGQQVLNLYKTVAHAPALFTDFFRLGNRILFQGLLPARLRELAILRVGDLAQAPYEFTKHREIGLNCGVRVEQIEALPRWERAPEFDEQERAVLRYTDEVTRGYRASGAAFAALKRSLSDAQIVELTVTIGFYGMICRVLEALQVDIEEDFKPF
jgi:alkylhydroperoxidase family enzyme